MPEASDEGSVPYNESLNCYEYQENPPGPLLYSNDIDFPPQAQELSDAAPVHRFSSQGVVLQDANNQIPRYDGRNHTQYNYNGGQTTVLGSVAMPMPTICPGSGLISTPNNDSFAPSVVVSFGQAASVCQIVYQKDVYSHYLSYFRY